MRLFNFSTFTAFFLQSHSANAFQLHSSSHVHPPFVDMHHDKSTSRMATPSNDDEIESLPPNLQSRRTMFQTTAAMGLATLATAIPAMADETESTTSTSTKKVLVLGATGFVGSRVVQKLQELGITVIGTSRSGRDGTFALDFTSNSPTLSQDMEQLAQGCDAVISCIGSIGTSTDGIVNAGTGLMAVAAQYAKVSKFIYISVAPEVKAFATNSNIGFLNDYMKGKSSSETAIVQAFPSSYTLIQPTFIYGGESYQINPPRVAENYGSIVESILSTKPLRSASQVLPGFLGIALEPPINVKDVAAAAVASALGYSTEPILDTYDEIRMASSLLN